MQFMKIVFQQEEEEKNRNFLLISKRVEVCFGENHQQKLKISSSNLLKLKANFQFPQSKSLFIEKLKKEMRSKEIHSFNLKRVENFPSGVL